MSVEIPGHIAGEWFPRIMRTFHGFRRTVLLILLHVAGTWAIAQDSLHVRPPGLFYPSPMTGRNWQSSIGFISIATPEDLTEEVRLRAPAGDWHVQRRLTDRFLLDGRLLFQVLQNQISIGPRWHSALGDRVCVGVGDDLSYWAGRLGFAGFDSRAHGWTNTPNVSLGYRFGKDYLLTLKQEVLITLSYKNYNGELSDGSDNAHVNGAAFTIALEQPFYHQKHVTLAFTAMYTDFYWVTWSLYNTFQRRIFYPQFTVGFIL